jgi:hypothetical protein
MAVITASTFDPLRRYTAVRLQQGVPIVDADWNELDDQAAYELRAFRRLFIGDGVPVGTDGAFLVVGTGAADDVVIRKGAADPPSGTTGLDRALHFAGHCTVDGLDVFITDDLVFSAQPLHASHGTSAAAESARLGVPIIAATSAPASGSTTWTFYLDVWERLVTPTEDPSLVLPALGTESCARIKREWVVRVRMGSSVPSPSDADYIPQHAYFALATVRRTAGVPAISATDVTDVRQRQLTLADLAVRVAKVERLTILPAFAASPNQFDPKLGSPGQPVRLHGRNFNLGTVQVLFGGVSAPVTSTTPVEIDVTLPAGVVGAVHVTVRTDGGLVVSDDTFNAVPPPPAPVLNASPNQFAPKIGSTGTPVNIFGHHFDVGGVMVAFGSTNAVPTSVTESQIVVAVPPFPPSPVPAVPITVTTIGGSVTSTDLFTKA